MSAGTSDSVRLTGHVPSKAIANSALVGNVDPNSQVPVTFTLPLRNQEALETLLQGIYDPTNQESYGNYLTSDEFTDQFAPTQEDYDKVTAYAEGLGLTVSTTHPNRLLLNVVGSASSVQSAFNLNLKRYKHASGREIFCS